MVTQEKTINDGSRDFPPTHGSILLVIIKGRKVSSKGLCSTHFGHIAQGGERRHEVRCSLERRSTVRKPDRGKAELITPTHTRGAL